jgi:hypothetical protein
MSDLQVLLEGHAASVGVQLEETPIVAIPANIFRIQFGYSERIRIRLYSRRIQTQDENGF